MRTKLLTAKQLSSVSCPTCGVGFRFRYASFRTAFRRQRRPPPVQESIGCASTDDASASRLAQSDSVRGCRAVSNPAQSPRRVSLSILCEAARIPGRDRPKENPRALQFGGLQTTHDHYQVVSGRRRPGCCTAPSIDRFWPSAHRACPPPRVGRHQERQSRSAMRTVEKRCETRIIMRPLSPVPRAAAE